MDLCPSCLLTAHPTSFWRAQAGEEPVEGAGVPGVISTRFCPVHPLKYSLDLLLAFAGSFLFLENTVQDRTVTV